MASLKSMIAGGRFLELPTGEIQRVYREAFTMLQSPDTIAVNAQSVWRDLSPLKNDWRDIMDFRQPPRPKPPYPHMWLEAIHNGDRFGILARRFEAQNNLDSLLDNESPAEYSEALRRDSPATIVWAEIWLEVQGAARYDSSFSYWLDGAGHFLSLWPELAQPPEDDREERCRIFYQCLWTAWVLHTFARLNCANTKLVPLSDGRPQRHRHDSVPSSIWHEIQVTSVPKLRQQQATVAADGEHREVRFHWVRGHYADYTKGAGLFGNPKLRAVFWIPEHRAGNEELRTVAASYRVEA
jgi:hypothetical protein